MTPRVRSRTASWIGLALLGCALPGTDAGRRAQLETEIAWLAAAGFEFDADVAFVADRYAGCDGLACADVRVIESRRTIVVAYEAFDGPGRLRLTLLEVWERYQTPRGGQGRARDLARSLLRVLRDGPRAGLDDPKLLRRAHVAYQKQYAALPPPDRLDLPKPSDIPYP